MTIEYQSPFMTVWYDAERKYIKSVWTAASERLTENTYKQEILCFLSVFKKYKPLKAGLADVTDFRYVISIREQTWVAELFEGYLPVKSAIIVPKDFIISLAVEQTFDEMSEGERNRFFDSIENAERWLFE